MLYADGGPAERVAHDWGDRVQTAPSGSFYLAEGYADFSGALNPSVPTDSLTDTGETREGAFWFFRNGHHRAGNGVDAKAPCSVYE